MELNRMDMGEPEMIMRINGLRRYSASLICELVTIFIIIIVTTIAGIEVLFSNRVPPSFMAKVQ